MNDMVKLAIGIIVASVGALIWGSQYRNDHPMALVGAFFGQSDPTYSLAGWAIGLGVLAFFVGVALLIGGLVRGREPSSGDGRKSNGLEF